MSNQIELDFEQWWKNTFDIYDYRRSVVISTGETKQTFPLECYELSKQIALQAWIASRNVMSLDFHSSYW